MSRYRRLALIGAAAVAFTIKLCLAWMTLGTNDVVTFELMLDKLNARGAVALYNEGTLATVNGRVQGVFQMNHPPFALTLLRLWGALRSFTGLPLGFWLRLSCAMADLLVLWLLYQRGMGAGDDWWALLILALSPVAIMVSGFHGNTDPLMIALVVLAVYLIETAKASWFAGASFGLACSIKVWPILLVPVLLLALRSMRRRIEFCSAAAIVTISAAMPVLLQAPAKVLSNVFVYSPVVGFWGLNYVYSLVPYLRNAMFLCVLLATIYMYGRVKSVFAQCGIVTALFFLLTPGFGPQYLMWILPWTVAAGWQASAGLHVSAGIFLFGMYNSWCGGRLPWYFADANYFGPSSWVLPVGLIPWGMMIVLIFQLYRRCMVRSQKEVKIPVDPRTQGRPTRFRQPKHRVR